MKSYITIDEYKQYGNGTIFSEKNPEIALNRASRLIDVLTYNRILGENFENLSEYQKQTIKEICAEIADFYSENSEFVNSVVSGYSINGVSMQFGNNYNVKSINGCIIPNIAYSRLISTGLCYGGI